MTTRTTLFCSSCGTENPIGGRFCSACGVVMGEVAGTPGSGPATPAGAAATVVREGLAGTLLQRVAVTVSALLAALLVCATVLGMGATSGIVWATRRSGALTEVAHPAILYAFGTVLAIVLLSAFFRNLAPKRADVGMKALRHYRRTLRERDGIRVLLQPGGVRTGVVVVCLLWLGLAGIAWYNLGDLRDQGADIAFGMWVSIVVPLIALVPTIALWPFGAERVFMDRQGVITRG